MKPLHFSILSEVLKSLQEILQATLELANTSMQKSEEKFNTEKGIYDSVNSNNIWSCAMCIDSWMTRTVPGCSRCQGGGRSGCRPCPMPSPPIPCEVTCSLSLGVLEWTGPPQARRLWFNPPGSLGNWSHPLPLVSAWSAVDYSQRAAAALSPLDQLSAAWCKCLPVCEGHL